MAAGPGSPSAATSAPSCHVVRVPFETESPVRPAASCPGPPARGPRPPGASYPGPAASCRPSVPIRAAPLIVVPVDLI
ncbi:hypothetical protein EYF80_029283 [Liparis tanakae]|uniref:Uncharacterized protein n=1 Tax=Liparis tanakae TaxID=230148 RepID=A0A4Z2H6C6_9TELE|nr:hypothetical protein EYF80_029283 [Liparis tanakae]